MPKPRARTWPPRSSRVNELNLEVEKITAERTALQNDLAQYTGEVAAVQKQIDEMTAEEARLQKRLDVIAPSAVKDYFLNAPLLDFLAPTLKIQQIILPNVVDDVNFIRVPKMDRCQTCHLAIDKKGYEKYPQPFTTHPNLDRYVGSNSPHPIDKTGCTVCHEGMGQSVSFADAAHTPSTPKQKEEWEKTYHWEEPHLWDFPMLPTGMTEASCAKCHKQEVYIPNADKLTVAFATFERAGCYACHKTKGFDVNMKKPGPILTKIDSKLTPDWVKTWIRNPRAVKETTWMPRFWYNSNNSSPEDAVRNEAEINAIVAYLFANAEKHEFAVKNPPRGDAKAGEGIVKSIGCLGLPRRRRRQAQRDRTAAHVRPAARERRQQDDLRVDLQLGSRSQALQPGHLHAQPAVDRRAGGRRGDVSVDAQGPRRRPGEGHSRSEGRRRCALRLL